MNKKTLKEAGFSKEQIKYMGKYFDIKNECSFVTVEASGIKVIQFHVNTYDRKDLLKQLRNKKSKCGLIWVEQELGWSEGIPGDPLWPFFVPRIRLRNYQDIFTLKFLY